MAYVPTTGGDCIKVFIANDTITLWNWEVLQSGGKLHRTVINGVNYQGLKTAFLSGTTVLTGDSVNIVIPLKAATSNPYMAYAEWLKSIDKANYWTLSEHSYVVNGDVTATAATVTELNKELSTVKVTGFDLYTLRGLEHWSVMCK